MASLASIFAEQPRSRRRARGLGQVFVDENGNTIDENGNVVDVPIDENGNALTVNTAPAYSVSDVPQDSAYYEEPVPTATIDAPVFVPTITEPVYDSSSREPSESGSPPPDAYAYPTEPAPMNFASPTTSAISTFDPASFDLATFEQPTEAIDFGGGNELVTMDALTAGGIDHFADFTPPGGIHEAQVRLAAWGRPRTQPDNASPYGFSGDLAPGDFGLQTTDLDGADSPRVGMAIASFQRWANVNRGAGLPQNGMYTEATHAALVKETGGPVPTSFPSSGTPTNVLPGPWPGSSGQPGNVLPPGWTSPNSPPGTSSGAAPTARPIPWLWIALAAAASAFVIVFVVRKRRRSAK